MRFKATVITSDGQRALVHLLCPSRTEAEQFIERAYPEARYVSLLIIHRLKPC
jgi:hypothetical protein